MSLKLFLALHVGVLQDSNVHDHMPLIVDRSHIEDWLNSLDFARTCLSADMPELERIIIENRNGL